MAGGLQAAVEEMPAVDGHAHVLAAAGHEPPLARVLTESSDPAQLEQVRHHPSYRRALRDLAAFAGCEPDEEPLGRRRRDAGRAAWSRRLLAASRLSTILVDDGFTFPGSADRADLASVAGCAVRRVVRVESSAEEAARGSSTLDEARQRFRAVVRDGLDAGAVALKTIAAYRSGLDLQEAEVDSVTAAYEGWRSRGFGRLSHPALVSFFVAEALEVIGPDPVPVQVHTGFGDADLDLRRADPLLLRPLLARTGGHVPFVLLHCYPYVSGASWLAGVHANVFLDLSLAMTLVSHRGPDLVLGALEQAPASKLMFGTDASRLPEAFFLGARWWRSSLARALSHLVDEGFIDEPMALEWAGLVLSGNARGLYGL